VRPAVPSNSAECAPGRMGVACDAFSRTRPRGQRADEQRAGRIAPAPRHGPGALLLQGATDFEASSRLRHRYTASTPAAGGHLWAGARCGQAASACPAGFFSAAGRLEHASKATPIRFGALSTLSCELFRRPDDPSQARDSAGPKRRSSVRRRRCVFPAVGRGAQAEGPFFRRFKEASGSVAPGQTTFYR
jgi:hypothetical protein